MEEFGDETDLASHHYARRLISTSFGNWIQLVSENARIKELSIAKAESYLRRKSRNSAYPTEQSLAMRRDIIRWMNYCNDQLKHRGQQLLGRIARQKLLLAKGYRRFRQFYVDEISMRRYGIARPLSSEELSAISGKHLHSKAREMKRKFLRILRGKCIRKNATRQKLCQLNTENSSRLRNGSFALAFLRQWRRITQIANKNQTAYCQAIKHKKEYSLWTAFVRIRKNRKMNRNWRQLYSICDHHYYERKVGFEGLIPLRQRQLQMRRYFIPRMYKALQFWKKRQGRRVFLLWRSRLSERIFRERSLQKLDAFDMARKLRKSLSSWRSHVEFRRKLRDYALIKRIQSEPRYHFFAKLRYILRWERGILAKHEYLSTMDRARRYFLKKKFHDFIYQRMNGFYFPVVLRRQAAYWRKACFHDGQRKLSMALYALRRRIEENNLNSFSTQRECLCEAIHHWKKIKLQNGLRRWSQRTQQQRAFRFFHRQALVQAQPSFQRQQLLSRCFGHWKHQITKSLQQKRQRIRDAYHLGPVTAHPATVAATGASPKAPQQSMNSTAFHDILPAISPETRRLRENVRVTIGATDHRSVKADPTDLIRAMPKPLSVAFPALPDEVKFGTVAAVFDPPQPIRPQWLSAMNTGLVSSASSIQSSYANASPSHVPPRPEEKHWSDYLQTDLATASSRPLPPHIAVAIQPIIGSLNPKRDAKPEQSWSDRELAKAPPRDGKYHPESTTHHHPQFPSVARRDFIPSSGDSVISTHSDVSSSMSSLFPSDFLQDGRAPEEIMHFIAVFVQRLQAVHPDNLKRILKQSPEKRRVFQEIKRIIQAMHIEQQSFV